MTMQTSLRRKYAASTIDGEKCPVIVRTVGALNHASLLVKSADASRTRGFS